MEVGVGREQMQWALRGLSKPCKGKRTRLTLCPGKRVDDGISPIPTWGSYDTQFFSQTLASTFPQ